MIIILKVYSKQKYNSTVKCTNIRWGLGRLPISCIDDNNDFTQILVECPDTYLITTNIYAIYIL